MSGNASNSSPKSLLKETTYFGGPNKIAFVFFVVSSQCVNLVLHGDIKRSLGKNASNTINLDES